MTPTWTDGPRVAHVRMARTHQLAHHTCWPRRTCPGQMWCGHRRCKGPCLLFPRPALTQPPVLHGPRWSCMSTQHGPCCGLAPGTLQVKEMARELWEPQVEEP